MRGRATLGYGMAVGSNDEQNDTLLQSVSKLLEQLLASGNEEELGVLLSLSGAQPSEIKGSSTVEQTLVFRQRQIMPAV